MAGGSNAAAREQLCKRNKANLIVDSSLLTHRNHGVSIHTLSSDIHSLTVAVSLVTLATSVPLPVRRGHTTARRGMHKPIASLVMSNMALGLSRRVASPPIPVLAQSVSILSAPAAETASSVLCVSTPATSPGALRASPRRPVLSVSSTTLPTTSSSAPTPSPAPPSSRLMPPPSDNGTRPTTACR
jgi:hypothetical protein